MTTEVLAQLNFEQNILQNLLQVYFPSLYPLFAASDQETRGGREVQGRKDGRGAEAEGDPGSRGIGGGARHEGRGGGVRDRSQGQGRGRTGALVCPILLSGLFQTASIRENCFCAVLYNSIRASDIHVVRCSNLTLIPVITVADGQEGRRVEGVPGGGHGGHDAGGHAQGRRRDRRPPHQDQQDHHGRRQQRGDRRVQTHRGGKYTVYIQFTQFLLLPILFLSRLSILHQAVRTKIVHVLSYVALTNATYR